MQFRELAAPGVIELIPKIFPDERGRFVALDTETYRAVSSPRASGMRSSRWPTTPS